MAAPRKQSRHTPEISFRAFSVLLTLHILFVAFIIVFVLFVCSVLHHLELPQGCGPALSCWYDLWCLPEMKNCLFFFSFFFVFILFPSSSFCVDFDLFCLVRYRCVMYWLCWAVAGSYCPTLYSTPIECTTEGAYCPGAVTADKCPSGLCVASLFFLSLPLWSFELVRVFFFHFLPFVWNLNPMRYDPIQSNPIQYKQRTIVRMLPPRSIAKVHSSKQRKQYTIHPFPPFFLSLPFVLLSVCLLLLRHSFFASFCCHLSCTAGFNCQGENYRKAPVPCNTSMEFSSFPFPSCSISFSVFVLCFLCSSRVVWFSLQIKTPFEFSSIHFQ